MVFRSKQAAGFRQRTLPAAVASGLTPYTGIISTRCYTPTTLTGATNAVMSRTAHIAVQAITTLQIELPGFACSGAGGAEIASALVTYTASIEYPAATFTQVTWSAATSKQVALGTGTGLSDVCTVAIPAGAQYWVRNHCDSPGNLGGLIPCTQGVVSTRWTAAGEASVLSNGTTPDLTMAGTVTDGGTGAFIYPVAIVATTTQPTFLCYGDSRTLGSGMTPDANGNQGQITTSLGASYGFINASVSGSQISASNLAGQQRLRLSAYCSHVIFGFGVNDIRSGGGNRSLVQFQGDVGTFSKLFSSKGLSLCTISPVTTSTDAWATAVNQTVDSQSGVITNANTWLKTVPSPFGAGYVSPFTFCSDIDNAVEDAGAAGKWKSPGYTADGLHQNATAVAAIVAGGTITGAALGARSRVSQFSMFSLASLMAWGDVSDPATALTVPAFPWVSRGGRPTFSAGTVPTYGAASFNSGPGYTFNGTTQNCLGDATYYKALTNGATGIALVLLFQIPSNPAAQRAIFGATVNGSNNERASIQLDSSGRPGIVYRRLDADAATSAFSTAALSLATPHLLVAVFDPVTNTAYLRVDGVQVASGVFLSTGNFSATNSNNTFLCTLNALFAACTIREVDMLNAAPSAANVLKIEGDVAWRQGVNTIVLPVGHTYYAGPPTS